MAELKLEGSQQLLQKLVVNATQDNPRLKRFVLVIGLLSYTEQNGVETELSIRTDNTIIIDAANYDKFKADLKEKGEDEVYATILADYQKERQTRLDAQAAKEAEQRRLAESKG